MARRAIAAVAAIVSSGYVSSFASLRECEHQTAERLAGEFGGREAFVLPDGLGEDSYPGALEILRRAGFIAHPCTNIKTGIECLPWAGVETAEIVGPFLVDVRWGYVAGPTMGNGVRTRYVTFFGAALALEDFGDWHVAV